MLKHIRLFEQHGACVEALNWLKTQDSPIAAIDNCQDLNWLLWAVEKLGLLEEYLKIEQPALEEYLKIQRPAWEEYLRIERPAYEEYKRIQRLAYEEYKKIERPALEEYKRIQRPALEEYEKIQRLACVQVLKTFLAEE